MIIRQAEFARRLMQARVKQKLRPKDILAELKEMRVGVSRQTYSNWEHGFSLPKQKYIIFLAEILEVEPEWLRNGDAKDGVAAIRQVKSVLRQCAKDLSFIEQQLKRG